MRQGLGRLELGRIARGAALAAVVAALAGCASIREHRGYLVDKTLVDSVQPGIDNQMSVERTLGRPTFASQFGDPAWYYVALDTKQAPLGRPRIYDGTVMRVRFDQAGNVLGVDKKGVENVARISPDDKKTPTLGRDRSFLQDLFGNIGAVGAPGMGGGGGGGNTGPGPNGS